MSDLHSLGDYIAAGALPAGIAGIAGTTGTADRAPLASPASSRPALNPRGSTPRNRGRAKRIGFDVTSESSRSHVQRKLDEINALRAEARAQEQAERRARWEADRAALAGPVRCLSCLDSGRDYLTELDCLCAAGEHRAAERERQQIEERLAFIARESRSVMDRAGVPSEYATWTLATFPRRTRSLAQVREWAEGWNERDGLLLFGSYGVGKTSLMIGLMRELVTRYLTTHPERVVRARFKRASQFFTELRAAMDSKDESYDRLITEAKQVRVFVLDDLGRENPKSEWVSETLFEIIDARYSHGLPIFATTNYSPETLPARLGVHAEAIMERVNDRCDWLKVGGVSMRKAQARVLE